MVWGIAFGELLYGGLWGVFCGYVGMRTHFLSINPVFAFLPPAFAPTRACLGTVAATHTTISAAIEACARQKGFRLRR